MDNWYDYFLGSVSKTASALPSEDGDLSTIHMRAAGMTAFLSDIDLSSDRLEGSYTDRRASAETPTRIRVASVSQLQGFSRIASNTLVRHAEQDFWELKQGDDGQFYIERLFDDNGEPLKV